MIISNSKRVESCIEERRRGERGREMILMSKEEFEILTEKIILESCYGAKIVNNLI